MLHACSRSSYRAALRSRSTPNINPTTHCRTRKTFRLPFLQIASTGISLWQGYLTKEQEAKLRELRDAFPQSAAFHTDHDLLRFLRAREFNMKATRVMYQHYLSMVRCVP